MCRFGPFLLTLESNLFSNSDHVTGWQGFIRVDNVTYNWMGGAPGASTVNQTSFEYTSTKSTFTFDVDGKVTLTATFLSPVHPTNLLQQSMQFSYLQASVKSADGDHHNVQVYSDISGGERVLFSSPFPPFPSARC